MPAPGTGRKPWQQTASERTIRRVTPCIAPHYVAWPCIRGNDQHVFPQNLKLVKAYEQDLLAHWTKHREEGFVDLVHGFALLPTSTALTYTLVTRRLSGFRNTLERSSGCGEMTASPVVRLCTLPRTRHDSGLQCKRGLDNPQGSQIPRKYFKQLVLGKLDGNIHWQGKNTPPVAPCQTRDSARQSRHLGSRGRGLTTRHGLSRLTPPMRVQGINISCSHFIGRLDLDFLAKSRFCRET